MIIKIKHTRTGNCKCLNCQKIQEGRKYHPYTVWFKKDDEPRGHNFPVCSLDCAKELAKKFETEDPTSKYSTRNNF